MSCLDCQDKICYYSATVICWEYNKILKSAFFVHIRLMFFVMVINYFLQLFCLLTGLSQQTSIGIENFFMCFVC